jgi:hypothetical protein
MSPGARARLTRVRLRPDLSAMLAEVKEHEHGSLAAAD